MPRDHRVLYVRAVGNQDADCKELLVDNDSAAFSRRVLARCSRTGEFVIVHDICGLSGAQDGHARLRVTRGAAGSTAQSLLDGDELLAVGIIPEETYAAVRD